MHPEIGIDERTNMVLDCVPCSVSRASRRMDMLDALVTWLLFATKVVAVWTLVSFGLLAVWCALVHFARMEHS